MAPASSHYGEAEATSEPAPTGAERLTLAQPDDWHLHLRDGARLGAVVAHTASVFARALIMPNLVPPVTTVEQAHDYRYRILAACQGVDFEPLMTLYLTPATEVAEIRRAAVDPHVVAAKLYPAGATTHSEAGVKSIEALYAVFEAMAEHGLVLCVHGESTDPEVDVFDREARFIEDTLSPLVDRFPTLKLVFEHATTADAVRFVQTARPGVAATLTAHHLLYDRNALFKGGIRPDLYCLPVLKRAHHRRALLAAATSGSPRFFLGTDSAPHPRSAKHCAAGCAGIYTAHAALPLYAEAFESQGALARLEGFASHFGADFYGLPRNEQSIELVREAWLVPEVYDYCGDLLTPLRAGEMLPWRVAWRARPEAREGKGP